jgi:hypothetical protein
MKRAIQYGALAAMMALPLAGCAGTTPGGTNSTVTNLTAIANEVQSDLTTAIAVANAATPPDTAGAACAAAMIQVSANIQKVAAVGQGGVFTTAEIASLYAPGSAQFNAAVTTIETGCIAKLHSINQAGASAAGFPAALAAGLAIAAAPAGL